MKDPHENVVLQSYYSDLTGVVDVMIGQQKECLVTDPSDTLGVLGFVMTALSQKLDVKITHYFD